MRSVLKRFVVVTAIGIGAVLAILLATKAGMPSHSSALLILFIAGGCANFYIGKSYQKEHESNISLDQELNSVASYSVFSSKAPVLATCSVAIMMGTGLCADHSINALENDLSGFTTSIFIIAQATTSARLNAVKEGALYASI